MKRNILTRLALGLAVALGLPCHAQPAWPPRTFTAYYGKLEAATPAQLAGFDLLILHPGEKGDNLDPGKLAALRQTGRSKTLVGYISLGEDSASPGGPPLRGQDQSGPSYVGKDLLPALAGNGYPSYYLDQRKLSFSSDGFPQRGANGRALEEKGQDGHPDENGVWGSYYVKAGDPAWQEKVFARLDQLDKLGLDGFFLDTVDTASPWGDYGWTASGMLDLIAKIRARYPKKRIIANRGLFYLSGNDRFASLIDAVLFESMLSAYQEETRSASISPWARWHVQALQDDVIPAQKRTGMLLLVLDYLDPQSPEAPLLIQSARTLLQGTPHCLTYSHPRLDIPGWSAESLLPDPAPASWPAVTGIELEEGPLGAFKLDVSLDGPVPAGAIPDLRLTSREDVVPARAAELPLTPLQAVRIEGNHLTATGAGLDKATSYKAFFRLVSRSASAQSPFGWTSLATAPSSLPGQVGDLSSESTAEGLLLNFTPDKTGACKTYRVYGVQSDGRRLLYKEGSSPPLMLSQPALGEATRLLVVGVSSQGEEGYPSVPLSVVRRDVTPPASPAAVSIAAGESGTTFSWSPVEGAKTYRLFAIPANQRYRLPLVSKETSLCVRGARKGTYRVFATAVDENGNQSPPGPSVEWTVE
jgi:hypothetical protein